MTSHEHLSEAPGFVRDDGGRRAAGFKGSAGDCVVRAIAIATGRDYHEVYKGLHGLAVGERRTARRRRPGANSPRNGMRRSVYDHYLALCGWTWVPCMGIGTGTRVHLRADELPPGRLVVRLSGHLAAVIDGVVHDTGDPSRGGTRAVYGYWRPPTSTEREETAR